MNSVQQELDPVHLLTTCPSTFSVIPPVQRWSTPIKQGSEKAYVPALSMVLSASKRATAVLSAVTCFFMGIKFVRLIDQSSRRHNTLRAAGVNSISQVSDIKSRSNYLFPLPYRTDSQGNAGCRVIPRGQGASHSWSMGRGMNHISRSHRKKFSVCSHSVKGKQNLQWASSSFGDRQPPWGKPNP